MADLPTIEGFRILEELGSGTLSSVYSAVDEPLGRMVALKVLKNTVSPSSPFATQLEHEARVLAELCHPNIGLLLAFSKTESGMYIVLEFVDGFSLATLLKRKPAILPDSVAAIGAAIARGLAHAHDQGIVHRDIKPANILVSRHGEVKIFDFGIAQRARGADDAVALSGVHLEDVVSFGTPAYMSPEQILGEGVDARSDVFSLGILLYELVGRARPFERGDGSDRRPVAHRIRRDPPIPLHRRAPDVPAALERIVMRAIEKLPGDRFPTADAMAEALEQLAGAPAGLRGDRRVMRCLESAGLVSLTGQEPSVVPARPKRSSAGLAIGGLGVLGAVAVVSGAFLQSGAARKGDGEAAVLELVPSTPGFVRVLATPWAEVWIDGQRVEVTPFARAIPLAAGTHYVTLIHPRAPVEKRIVDVASGETRTLDVVMNVPAMAPREDARGPSAERERKR